MDRLEAMSTFLAVVEAGSLSAASRRLNTPLATVSRKISELESRLRTKLFDRTTRKLVLTALAAPMSMRASAFSQKWVKRSALPPGNMSRQPASSP